MTDPTFTETLYSWHDFYFMIGGASAALLGLMFVALSLGQHLINEMTRNSFEVFAEPNIFYFVTVLLIAGMMLVPSFTPAIFAWVVLVAGLIGLGRTGYAVWLLIRAGLKHGDFNLGDWMGQVILPFTAYLLLPAAGIGFVGGQWSLGLALIAIATVLVLLVGIINTWGIVIWIIYQHRE